MACANDLGLIGVVCKVAELLNYIVPVLITLGIVYFVYGVITYMISADEEQKTKGRDKIIYGLIGLAAIVAMWGLVRILVNTFDLERNSRTPTPGEINNLLPQPGFN